MRLLSSILATNEHLLGTDSATVIRRSHISRRCFASFGLRLRNHLSLPYVHGLVQLVACRDRSHHGGLLEKLGWNSGSLGRQKLKLMVAVNLLLHLVHSLCALSASLNGLKVNYCSLVQVIEVDILIPVGFGAAKLLLSAIINHRDVVFQVLKRKVQFDSLASRRHRILWVINRAESLMHCLGRGSYGFQTRHSFLLVL
jgi:hypothetical protein